MSDPGTRRLRLNSSQRRHLEITLGRLLLEMEDSGYWLERWPGSDGTRDHVRQTLEGVQEKIRERSQELGLSPMARRVDPRRRLESLASHWWSSVLDCRSQVLRGYGELAEGTAPLLDPIVDELADAMMGLLSLLEEK